MTITLSSIPNINLLMKAISRCAGFVYLQLPDKSFLNMKNGGEGENFIRQYESGNKCSLTLWIEKGTDSARIANALA